MSIEITQEMVERGRDWLDEFVLEVEEDRLDNRNPEEDAAAFLRIALAEKPQLSELERTLLETMVFYKHLMFFNRLMDLGYVASYPSGYQITEAGREAIGQQGAEPEIITLTLSHYKALKDRLRAYGLERQNWQRMTGVTDPIVYE